MKRFLLLITITEIWSINLNFQIMLKSRYKNQDKIIELIINRYIVKPDNAKVQNYSEIYLLCNSIVSVHLLTIDT